MAASRSPRVVSLLAAVLQLLTSGTGALQTLAAKRRGASHVVAILVIIIIILLVLIFFTI